MVAPLRDPREPIDLLAWAKKDAAAMNPGGQEGPDTLQATLVPQERATESGPSQAAVDNNPAKPPHVGFDRTSVALPPGQARGEPASSLPACRRVELLMGAVLNCQT
jgi:hypothetical protein